MPSDAAAGVQARIKLCTDGLAEDAADQGQHAVGGNGVCFRDLVEDGLDFADADLGQAALGQVDAVLPVGQVLGELGQVFLVRFLVRLAVLLIEQREHLAEGDFRALLALLVGRVAAQRDLAVVLNGLGPRFVHREVGGAADLDALGAAVDLLVQNVGLDAAGADADRQTGNFGVVVILPADSGIGRFSMLALVKLMRFVELVMVVRTVMANDRWMDFWLLPYCYCASELLPHCYHQSRFCVTDENLVDLKFTL